MKRLENNICIITGADYEIGGILSLSFSREGASLMLTGTNEKKLEEHVNKIREEGNCAEFLVLPSIDESEIEKIFGKTKETFGIPDILINCLLPTFDVGGGGNPEPDWDMILSGNLKACYIFCRKAIDGMMKRGGGSIVNIAPGVGLQRIAREKSMAAVSGGIFSLTAALAAEYGSYDIRVNAISLGIFKTDEYRRIRSGKGPDFEKKLLRHIALDRLGNPEEVAMPAIFLASDESLYISGAILPVDGGYSGY